MPKRKRPGYEHSSKAASDSRKNDVQQTLVQSKKLLNRALKTAKGFERQKLGKRLKLATTNNQADAIARTNREIEACKVLDVSKLTDAHLHKTLLKIKAFAESELLPDEVRKTAPKPEGPEETLAAIHNVTSGIYNMKPVKDTMQQIVSGMYVAMGLPIPANGKASMTKKESNQQNASSRKEEDTERENLEEEADINSEVSWEGFDSDQEEEEDQNDEEDSGTDSLDEEELSRYDALLGGSSDEESFDEEAYKSKNPHQTSARLSLSLSPLPSRSSSPALSKSVSPSPSPEPEARPTKIAKSKPTPTKSGSTFLPTLMGGYWSGSESSASELEDFAPAARKNRRGQAARRAIAEKKYGEKANHIKSGKGPVGKKNTKDDGWDAKRGAKDSTERSRGFRGRDHHRGHERNLEKATGENAVSVAPKPRGMGRKDDVGILHPSWQAAKKAKEASKTATFQGKKVTFD
jgi:hypothetical protein